MNEDTRWNDENRAEKPVEEAPRPPEAPEQGGAPAGGGLPGFLELVYGVLFEPGKTMARVAQRPLLVPALLTVTILSLLGTLMGLLTAARVLDQSLRAEGMGQFIPVMRALMPFGVLFGLLWGYMKWFGYSAILHLAADLLGGRGGARGVFAATGLAGLPSIFMVPVQFLAYWFGTGKLAVTVLVGLAGLAVGIWSIVILAAGIKQVHGLSTGRSFLVVCSPFLALAVLGILIIVALAAFAAAMPARMHLPGYF